MKLYTKTVCPKCMWVKSEIQRAELDVTEINIDKDEEGLKTVKDAGFLAVPVLEIDGELIGDINDIMERIRVTTK